ncbi:MAG: tetratricopeptide repeat protein [Candidatus Marinimicrobia bacterium]|nr:tetratricopeptide repeat protein [Candidatus Neomarinimicrobiota bacterium]
MIKEQKGLSTFIQELRNRRVFRVATVYLGTGFVILEAADMILPRLGLPDWTVTFIMILLGLGFPVALGLAWTFQFTPDGLKRSPKTGEKQSPDSKPFTGNAIIIVLLALILGVLAYPRFSRNPDHSSLQNALVVLDEKSVAVLPFTPFTKTAEDESFADGMHDDILTQLSKVGELKVISRTSVMKYKETTKSIPEIAEELGVVNLLEGSVRRAGDQIRIVAQLINARTDEHLWAETYDRTYADIFSIQSDVARKIASALKAKLSPQESSYIESHYTDDPDAWELYLKAKLLYAADITDKDSIVVILNQAVEKDPDFLLPYALLTRINAWLYFDGTGTYPTPERLTLAQKALDKTIFLNPDAPETHMAKGYFQYYAYRNYQKALEEMNLALEMQPNNTELIAGVAYVNRRLGQWGEATRQMEKAVSLDPNDAQKVGELRDMYLMLKDWERGQKFEQRLEAVTGGVGPEVDNGRYWIPLWVSGGDIVASRKTLDDLIRTSGKKKNRGKRFNQAIYERDFDLAYAVAMENGQLSLSETLSLLNKVSKDLIDLSILDSLMQVVEEQAVQEPNNWVPLADKALILAAQGHSEEAIKLAKSVVKAMPLSRDALGGADALTYLGDIYLWSGLPDLAIQTYEAVLAVPNWNNRTQFLIDPYYDPLRGHPDFGKLLPNP